ncbi:hypothetical protein [Azorhizobium sp. AG788]|uniref:hypothetical protein n=1 Tax=Azorhizobium sp. AG788 TaxID=2183897 RepID=UPI003138A540
MSVPEESNAALPIQLVRCAAGHYHVPGPCPICDAATDAQAHVQTPSPSQALAFPRRRSPLSWLFLFNVIAASLALVAVAVAWVAVFHEPNRPVPAKVEQVAQVQPSAPAAPAVQSAQAVQAAAAVQPPAIAPEPVTEAPAATALQPAPMPLPRPASAETTVAAADDPAAAPQAPKPPGADPAPPPANPALMAALMPQPPRSSLPLPQRLGVPPSIIQQVRWLDGRTIEILVRALDRQPDETDVIEERPSGDVVRGRLRGGPRPCRYMELYPAQRSNAFMLLRFCPDAMGRWMGQEANGY